MFRTYSFNIKFFEKFILVVLSEGFSCKYAKIEVSDFYGLLEQARIQIDKEVSGIG